MPKIDANKCIGCGLCVDLCPDVFRLGSAGRAEVIKQRRGEDVSDAASSCPAGAISIQ